MVLDLDKPSMKMAVANLSEKQLGNLIKSLVTAGGTGGRPEGLTDDVVIAYFNVIVLEFESMKIQKEKTRQKNIENGKKGGRPRKESKTQKTQNNPNNPVGFLGYLGFENESVPHVNNINNIINSLSQESLEKKEREKERENFDFSELPESLQKELSKFWAIRAQAGQPIFSLQQVEMVYALMSAVNGDFARAERWVKNASTNGLRMFLQPFEEKTGKPTKPDKSRGTVAAHPADAEKYKKFNTEMEF
jgi:hypothetical protein